MNPYEAKLCIQLIKYDEDNIQKSLPEDVNENDLKFVYLSYLCIKGDTDNIKKFISTETDSILSYILSTTYDTLKLNTILHTLLYWNNDDTAFDLFTLFIEHGAKVSRNEMNFLPWEQNGLIWLHPLTMEKVGERCPYHFTKLYKRIKDYVLDMNIECYATGLIKKLKEKEVELDNVQKECKELQIKIIVENNNVSSLEKNYKKVTDIVNKIVYNRNFISGIDMVTELLPSVIIDDELFHIALSTRNEIIIKLFLTYVSVDSITPEQLEFFVPYDDSKYEIKLARDLSTILFEKEYTFGSDDTSQWFHTIIINNIALCKLNLL